MDVESDQSESPVPISEADFVRLFARHELALRNYARLILPDWTGVDDVLQDASITMWESPPGSLYPTAMGLVTLSTTKLGN